MQPISAKTFYASVQKGLIEPLGLKPTHNALTKPDDTETIDFAKASSVVLSLVYEHGKALYGNEMKAHRFAQKVGQRLEQIWQNGEINLRDCKPTIDETKKSIDAKPEIQVRERQTFKMLCDWAGETGNATAAL